MCRVWALRDGEGGSRGPEVLLRFVLGRTARHGPGSFCGVRCGLSTNPFSRSDHEAKLSCLIYLRWRTAGYGSHTRISVADTFGGSQIDKRLVHRPCGEIRHFDGTPGSVGTNGHLI
jgi:hypothetical protein